MKTEEDIEKKGEKNYLCETKLFSTALSREGEAIEII